MLPKILLLKSHPKTSFLVFQHITNEKDEDIEKK